MSKDHPVAMWVHPEFKKKIKVDSAMNDMSILDYTKKFAEQREEGVEQLQNGKKKEFKRFNLGF